MSRLRKDIAPGEPHIELRSKEVAYYVTSLFHLAPTYMKIVPLLIRDVLSARSPLDIYGSRAPSLMKDGYIFVKNHPIRKFKVCGRLMSFSSYVFQDPKTNEETEYISMYIDDSSGEKSAIRVRATAREIAVSALQDDILVEITGTLGTYTDTEKHIQCTEVKIVGSSLDISLELAWWASALETRKQLQSPWVYVPPKVRKDGNLPSVTFNKDDLRRRQERRKILQRSNEVSNENLGPKLGENAKAILGETSTHSALKFAPFADSFYLYDRREMSNKVAVDFSRPSKKAHLGPDCGRESQEKEMERTEVIDITGTE